MVIHVWAGSDASDPFFEKMIQPLRESLDILDTQGQKASVSIIARTDDVFCKVAIVVESEDEQLRRRIDQYAEHFRGMFSMGMRKTA